MRHYTPDERSRFVAQWRSSGMSRKAFAQQHGISQGSLTTWQKRVAVDEAPASFQPLVVSDAHCPQQKPAATQPVAELSVGVFTLRIYPSIDSDMLSRILVNLRKEATAC
jgi:transposase-like protein